MRIIKYILILILFLHARSTLSEPVPKLDLLAAKSIYKIVPPDNLKFQLMKTEEEIPVNPILYSDNTNGFSEFKCEHNSVFSIYTHANIMGSIKLSVCDAKVFTQSMVDKMKNNVDGFVSKYQARSSLQAMHDAGMYFDKSTTSNGDEAYYFPVIGIGHGFIAVRTIVLFPKNYSQVFVLQFYPNNLCSFAGYEMQESRLCEKGYDGLVKITETFMNDYRNK